MQKDSESANEKNQVVEQAVIGKHIAAVRSSKDEELDALRVDLEFKEGGKLIILLDRKDWGWSIALRRKPHEVCMGWVEPGGGHSYCCGTDSQSEECFRLSLEGVGGVLIVR